MNSLIPLIQKGKRTMVAAKIVCSTQMKRGSKKHISLNMEQPFLVCCPKKITTIRSGTACYPNIWRIEPNAWPIHLKFIDARNWHRLEAFTIRRTRVGISIPADLWFVNKYWIIDLKFQTAKICTARHCLADNAWCIGFRSWQG